MRLAFAVRGARRSDAPARLMAFLVLVGAGMIAIAIGLAILGRGSAFEVAVSGAVVQASAFLGALWWTVRHPEPRCDRGRR